MDRSFQCCTLPLFCDFASHGHIYTRKNEQHAEQSLEISFSSMLMLTTMIKFNRSRNSGFTQCKVITRLSSYVYFSVLSEHALAFAVNKFTSPQVAKDQMKAK